MFLLLLTAVARAAAADGLYLACHAGVALASADVRDVFLGEKQFQNTVRLVPVDNVAIQAAFLERVLKMNDIKYAVTWAKKSFRDGVSPPPAMANDAAVLDFIKRTPGGCGYLGTDPPQDVNVVGKY